MDPEDRNHQVLLPRCDEYVYHDHVHDDDRVVRERLLPLPEDVGYDYFPYGSKIPTSTTSTPDVYDYFIYFRYFPDVDYVSYFLQAPKTPALPRRSPLSGVEPEDPLHTCAPQTPALHTYALFSITSHLFL